MYLVDKLMRNPSISFNQNVLFPFLYFTDRVICSELMVDDSYNVTPHGINKMYKSEDTNLFCDCYASEVQRLSSSLSVSEIQSSTRGHSLSATKNRMEHSQSKTLEQPGM